MTQDEIIEMAKQAGCVEDKHYKGEIIFISNDALERFAKLVAAKEREACAKVVLSIANEDAGNPYKQALRMGADAIRARGQA
jgi:hypothetical protein